MFSVGTGFIPGKISLTSLSGFELSSSTKSHVVNSAKLGSESVNPSTLSHFISKTVKAHSAGLFGLYRSRAQVASVALTDLMAGIRKD